MREPKRLAHRQAERNKARALKRWSWDDGDEERPAAAATPGLRQDPAVESFLAQNAPLYQA
jgi:hypothetical protein